MELTKPSRPLPDVAFDAVKDLAAPLQWVGMMGIEVPVQLRTAGGQFQVPARVDAQVSLDLAPSRGIHMSRLFMTVQEKLPTQTLSLSLLNQLIEDFLKSHSDLSSSARVRVHLQWPASRKALVSDHSAWRTYPVVLSAEKTGEGAIQSEIQVLVTYSSTCPASAALSRQLIQEGFEAQFQANSLDRAQVHAWLGTTQGISATPHAQRSEARVKVRTEKLEVLELIDLIEEALQTPVQGAVKRADEQEFARRNGQNLMFCEDAARRVRAALESHPLIQDYAGEFQHLESLHPHAAVASITKGLPGGLTNY